MTDLDVFGTLVDGEDVERALLQHLAAWMDTYIGWVRRVKDPAGTRWPDGVAKIESYTVKHAAEEKWPEDQLPMLLAYCPGLAEPPVRRGDGRIEAAYACTLTAIAASVDETDTKALARLYSSAALGAIVQHPTLGGFATETTLGDLRNFPITRGVEAERSLMAVAMTFVIRIDEIVNTDKGALGDPADDPDATPDDLPRIDIEAQRERGSGLVTSRIIDD